MAIIRADQSAIKRGRKHDARPKQDLRQQLYNDRKCGPIERIQLPAEMITSLWAIELDIDPDNFRDEIVPASARANPRQFYKETVRSWLRRHPVLHSAEVRLSGRGLHVIIWFSEPVEFSTDGERRRWAGIVKAVQAVLPCDPDMPGITATTRALGSVNSKNGARVERLKAGRPVDSQSVLDLFDQLRSQPFRTVMNILFGAERCTPCPVCNKDDSTLSALDFVGRCYGSCGKVHLAQLYDVFFAPRLKGKTKYGTHPPKEAAHGQAQSRITGR